MYLDVSYFRVVADMLACMFVCFHLMYIWSFELCETKSLRLEGAPVHHSSWRAAALPDQIQN